MTNPPAPSSFPWARNSGPAALGQSGYWWTACHCYWF